MRPNEKIDDIINKTAELLSTTDGGEELTTRRIAENAGINPAMVNYYFGSKDDLLKAAISVMNRGRSKEVSPEHGGYRKAMFDLLIRECEDRIQYAKFRLNRDAESFSEDIARTSSRILHMKRQFGDGVPDEEDPVRVFSAVCFLMAASMDPEGFAEYSGIDVRIKGQLRMLASKQLDILLGDSL
ncbi:MAG: TetR/AcrR family transcriptional regulator [Candidatus Methanoplasma sp.]|jgi:AcrR family transcriptional regulator|nr:TetR/AcrR family transcriptional regulator [Candidatus Methanoplasma sp.]